MEQTASPCVRNCCLGEGDVCPGCFRHIDEIMQWREMTEHQKQAVIVLTAERRALHRRNYRNK
ncbi:MAG: DUF1289 domain-containing protein [Gammaproteobacteria bacterium]|nr:DUF1289 domain-containing protein [Gammaproteobacteria bacterium]